VQVIKKRKSMIVGTQSRDSLDGTTIPEVGEVKYLGIIVNQDPRLIVSQAFKDIHRYLTAIKGRLRRTDLEVKQALITAFVRSLIIYFATPLVAADLMKIK
jgi:hypothetical protein